MSDNLDIATDREELFRENALRARKPAGPEATGRCFYCDEALGDGQRWCDADHRDAWLKEQNRGRG